MVDDVIRAWIIISMMFAPIFSRTVALQWCRGRFPDVPWEKEKTRVLKAVAYRLRALAIKEIQDA